MSFSSVAEYSLTAIDTRPNETAPFQIARIPPRIRPDQRRATPVDPVPRGPSATRGAPSVRAPRKASNDPSKGVVGESSCSSGEVESPGLGTGDKAPPLRWCENQHRTAAVLGVADRDRLVGDRDLDTVAVAAAA